jgi:predicted ATP-grasp superfamily ATP-dependent carboligase
MSVPLDPSLVEAARRLLSAAGHWGLAQLDLVMEDDGPRVLDVNLRFYACMPLALHCGVNVPAAWHAALAGAPFDPPAPYAAGRRYRWLEADLVAALRGHPRRLFERPGATGAMWSADDPLPGVALGWHALLARARRRVRTRP